MAEAIYRLEGRCCFYSGFLKLTPFALTLKHFEKHRELPDAQHHSLSDPQSLKDLVDGFFQRSETEDNENDDYAPRPNRLLMTTEGYMSRAHFEVTREERHLERIDVHYRERRMFVAHQTPDQLEVFQSCSDPESPQAIECYRLDFRNPEEGFEQRMLMAAEPWMMHP